MLGVFGCQNKNYDFILKCLHENYIGHSPAGARSNQEAVNILIAVSKMFGDMQVSVEDIFSENGMVATRIRYKAVHIGKCEWKHGTVFSGLGASGT